ncbi:transposase [Prevotella fusca]
MIDRNHKHERFTATENMTPDKVADFLDRMSLRISKRTFVFLDNASVHRCRFVRELRPIWEKRRMFLFFLLLYSPHLNIAETLYCILKGKWLRPMYYFPKNPCSMPPAEPWRQSGLGLKSILLM